MCGAFCEAGDEPRTRDPQLGKPERPRMATSEPATTTNHHRPEGENYLTRVTLARDWRTTGASCTRQISDGRHRAGRPLAQRVGLL